METLNLLELVGTVCEGYFEKSLEQLIEDVKSRLILPENPVEEPEHDATKPNELEKISETFEPSDRGSQNSSPDNDSITRTANRSAIIKESF